VKVETIALVALEPHWIEGFGMKFGIAFRCPLDAETGRKRVAVYFANPINCSEPCPGEELWTRKGYTIETLTISPSISCGRWTGFIDAGIVSTMGP
jgi:hypothetical protein